MNVLLFVLLLMVPGILLAESQLQNELFFFLLFFFLEGILSVESKWSCQSPEFKFKLSFRFVMTSCQVLFILHCWSFICKMERLNGYS